MHDNAVITKYHLSHIANLKYGMKFLAKVTKLSSNTNKYFFIVPFGFVNNEFEIN